MKDETRKSTGAINAYGVIRFSAFCGSLRIKANVNQ